MRRSRIRTMRLSAGHAITLLLVLVATALVSAQQLAFPLTDKITALAGTWTRDASRGTGGICGVVESGTLSFELKAEAISITGREHWRVPLTGAATSDDGRAVASTDAGWLKITVTT